MGKEHTLGIVVVYTKEILGKELKKVKDFGGKIKIMLIAINMKVNILLIKRMDMESSNGLQVQFTKVNMWMMKEMGMEKCTLWMAQFTREIGLKDCNMGKDAYIWWMALLNKGSL